MHRAYQPITPANNMLLKKPWKKRWDDRCFDQDRKKVRNAKAVIDNKPPQMYMHLHLNVKKLRAEEERLATIERDNRIHLDKIMRTRGKVDCKNEYEQKSLNRTKRQREFLRVTHENQAILRRILSTEANYSHQQWEHEWDLNKQYMAKLAKYPQIYTLNKDERKFYEHQQRQQRQAEGKNSKPSFPFDHRRRAPLIQRADSVESSHSSRSSSRSSTTSSRLPKTDNSMLPLGQRTRGVVSRGKREGGFEHVDNC